MKKLLLSILLLNCLIFAAVNLIRLEAERRWVSFQWQEAVILNPFNRRYHFMLANAYYRAKQDEAARAHYRIALKLAPNYFDAASNLGLIYARNGHIKEAIKIYETILTYWPEHRESQAILTEIRRVLDE